MVNFKFRKHLILISILLGGVLALSAAIAPAFADGRGWHNKKTVHHKETRVGHYNRNHAHKHRWHQGRNHWRYQRPATYYRVIEPPHRHYPKYKRSHHKEYGNRHHYHNKKPSYYRGSGIDRVTGGQIIGAILGGVAGTQFGKGNGRTVAIAGGAILGAIIGGEVGKSMQAADQQQANHVLETTPTGQQITWNNPDTGRQYQMTPTKTYKTESNLYCREYTSRVTIGGSRKKVYGQACRMPDGSWKILN